MPRIPTKVVGDSEGAQVHNAMVDVLKSHRPMRGDGVLTMSSIYGTSRRAARRQFGGGVTAGWHFEDKIEADPTKSYPKQSVIHVQASSSLATTGIRDAANPTGPLVKSKPGYYVSVKTVPPKTTVSGNDVWNLPQWPEPNGADKDDALNFWLYLGEIYC